MIAEQKWSPDKNGRRLIAATRQVKPSQLINQIQLVDDLIAAATPEVK